MPFFIEKWHDLLEGAVKIEKLRIFPLVFRRVVELAHIASYVHKANASFLIVL